MGSCLKLCFIVSSSAGDSVHVGLPETRPLPCLPYRLEFQFLKKQLVHLIHFAFCILHLSVLIATCTKKISAPENTNTQTPTIPTLIIVQVRSGQVSTSSSAHLPHLYREIIFTYRRQPRPRYGRSQKKKLMIRAPIGFIVLKREGASSFSPLAERILSILF